MVGSNSSLTANRSRSRDARWKAAVVIGLLVALGFLAERSFTRRAAPPKPSTDERLVWIGPKTILLNPDQLGHEMIEWFDSGTEPSLAFELSDRSFQAGSANLSPLGMARVSQIARLMNAHPPVTATIEKPTSALSAADPQLNERRAMQLISAIAGQGVLASRLKVETEDGSKPTAKDAQLVVYLSK